LASSGDLARDKRSPARVGVETARGVGLAGFSKFTLSTNFDRT
jgi:hypothetical protein